MLGKSEILRPVYGLRGFSLTKLPGKVGMAFAVVAGRPAGCRRGILPSQNADSILPTQTPGRQQTIRRCPMSVVGRLMFSPPTTMALGERDRDRIFPKR